MTRFKDFTASDDAKSHIRYSLNHLISEYHLDYDIYYVAHPRESKLITSILPPNVNIVSGVESFQLFSTDIIAGYFSSVLLEAFIMDLTIFLMLPDYRGTAFYSMLAKSDKVHHLSISQT